MSKSKTKKRDTISVVYKFSDGQEHSIPIINVTKTMINQYIELKNSDDPKTKADMNRKLEEIANFCVEGQLSKKRQEEAGFRRGEEVKKESQDNRARFQKLAEDKWEKNPRLSTRAVAGMIAKPGESAETIRKHIKKPLQK